MTQLPAGAGTVWLLVAATVLLLVGVIAGWLLARRSAGAQIQAVAAQVKAEALVEVATLGERARSLEAERQSLSAELLEVRSQSAALRDALDSSRDERAQLGERAARVAVLEAEMTALVTRAERLAQDLSGVERRAAGLDASLKAEAETAETLRRELAVAIEAREGLQRQAVELGRQVAELTTQLNAERSQSQEKLALLTNAKDELSNQFKALANDILEEKTRKFSEQNQASLGQLLDPLRLRLQEFQGRVEKLYDTEGKERSALAQQVLQLLELNRTLADEAKNLTSALKGSAKVQGNWGELILERVLEGCGLRKGVEYETQASVNREEGGRAQADVVIRMPEERSLVVDAKVSLLAYEEYASSDEDDVRAAARKRHLDSIRAHVKGLSERNYQLLYGLKSIDFVLMFVPIEPAFMLAVTDDGSLFMDAWNRNVLLVSPSTLMFVLRTVAHLWRQEQQSRNAQEIARRGAELYDRLTAFVADLEKVGKNIKQASEAYGEAFDKLTKNKGNVIRQAEMLRSLGVKPTKSLPAPLVADAVGDSEGEFGTA
ncbi:DNA recombination protein RmuC [Ramlibacter henchirensis]|uniref:DNA recombination protein RmuC n=1 Tax=Ramlibacter henchirensis TaxID=204072 RepID=A0A4Z0BMA8_9BURK|nr:DNA recombination protein RmuC [Ramlibacter henchirensis]TFZ00456.1 DNA recombination protein RmuC [Ramlibacter henchirensis]